MICYRWMSYEELNYIINNKKFIYRSGKSGHIFTNPENVNVVKAKLDSGQTHSKHNSHDVCVKLEVTNGDSYKICPSRMGNDWYCYFNENDKITVEVIEVLKK